MKHIFLNLKRFDVPKEYGGVNAIAAVKDWGSYIVEQTQKGLMEYGTEDVEFAMFFPEAHILTAPPQALSPVAAHIADLRAGYHSLCTDVFLHQPFCCDRPGRDLRLCGSGHPR